MSDQERLAGSIGRLAVGFTSSTLERAASSRHGIVHSVVLGIVRVSVPGESTPWSCDVLQNSQLPLFLAEGDLVLVLSPGKDGRGIVLGRLAHGPGGTRVEGDVPDELVLEAKHSLTLRVGDGSITIREDGKILIKGKDLVSHATRLNRIKGGAVQIN